MNSVCLGNPVRHLICLGDGVIGLKTLHMSVTQRVNFKNALVPNMDTGFKNIRLLDISRIL